MLNPAFLTSPHPNEVGLSDHNLPDELFQLEPYDDWGSAPLPPLRDQSGAIVTDHGQRQYLAFDLPNQISIRPGDWRLQYYTDRLDPRIRVKDLYIRMHPGPGDTLLKENAINMQKTRLRKALNIACWNRDKGTPDLIECLEKEQLSWDSVLRNTSLPVLGPLGMIKRSLPNTTSPMPLNPPARIPLTRFTKGIDKPHVPSPRLVEIYQLISNLQCEAFERGCCHWIFLPNSAKPEEWTKKARSQRHARTGPEEIIFPARQDINNLALALIEDRIEAAAAEESGMDAPDVTTLPDHSRLWVSSCIARGRARKEAKLQAAMASQQQDLSDIETKQDEVEDQAELDAMEQTQVSQPHSYLGKRKGCLVDSPRKRIRVSQDSSYSEDDAHTSAMQPNAKKRKAIATDTPNKRIKLHTDPAPVAPYGNPVHLPSSVEQPSPSGFPYLGGSNILTRNNLPWLQQNVDENIQIRTSSGLEASTNRDNKVTHKNSTHSFSLDSQMLEAVENGDISTNGWSAEHTVNGRLSEDVDLPGWNSSRVQIGSNGSEYGLEGGIGQDHGETVVPSFEYGPAQYEPTPFGHTSEHLQTSIPKNEAQCTRPFPGNPWTSDQYAPLVVQDQHVNSEYGQQPVGAGYAQVHYDKANLMEAALPSQLGGVDDTNNTYWRGEMYASQAGLPLAENYGFLGQVENTSVGELDSHNAEDIGDMFECANQHFESWLKGNEGGVSPNTSGEKHGERKHTEMMHAEEEQIGDEQTEEDITDGEDAEGEDTGLEEIEGGHLEQNYMEEVHIQEEHTEEKDTKEVQNDEAQSENVCVEEESHAEKATEKSMEDPGRIEGTSGLAGHVNSGFVGEDYESLNFSEFVHDGDYHTQDERQRLLDWGWEWQSSL